MKVKWASDRLWRLLQIHWKHDRIFNTEASGYAALYLTQLNRIERHDWAHF